MRSSKKTDGAPGVVRLALELRAPWELGAALVAYPFAHLASPGDGHPVMVVPGLASGDMTTIVIRKFLAERGFDTYTWEQGLNFGPGNGALEACVARVHDIHRRTGRTVSLVGWSLGGVFAREIAKLLPECTRVVVSLGTPFTGNPKSNNAWRLYELVSGDRVENMGFDQFAVRPPVPTTSIFSRTDGVVAWQCSMEEETALSENIEVHASHIGMGANPSALFAIADRLAQPEGGWRRFDTDAHTGIKKLLYWDPQRTPLFQHLFGLY